MDQHFNLGMILGNQGRVLMNFFSVTDVGDVTKGAELCSENALRRALRLRKLGASCFAGLEERFA
jgi:hypothetical protein